MKKTLSGAQFLSGLLVNFGTTEENSFSKAGWDILSPPSLAVVSIYGSLISAFHAPSRHFNEIFLEHREQLCITYKSRESGLNDC